MLRVVIVSHAYIEEELRKGIAALADQVEVSVVTPATADVLVFQDLDVGSSGKFAELFTPFRRIRLFGAQYLLASADLGFRASRPDVVVVQYDPWSAMFWQALFACRLFARDAKIVCSVKKNTFRRRGIASGVKKALARVALGYVTRVMAASGKAAAMYKALFDLPDEQVTVVTQMGVDADHFRPAAPPRVPDPARATVGYAGRLEPHKGLADLVDAVAMCREAKAIDLRLEICGKGSMTPELERLAHEHDWLTMRGLVPNGQVPAFLQALDIFVLPARNLPDHEEHDAHALLEALACGLPCIATRSGINPELLEDGTGWLVDPQEPAALAGALGALVPDLPRRRDLAARARERAVAEFDNRSLACRKAQLFEEVRREQ